MSETLPADSQYPSFKEALWYWLRLGLISFGGPAGQIAIMHHDLVDKKRWITEERFLHALNYCMLLPGPEAQQLATYIGWMMHKTKGGLVAGVLFVLPSMLMLIGLGYVYVVYGATPIVSEVLSAIKPAVVAIILFAAHRMGSKILHHVALWGVALCAFMATVFFQWPFPLVIGLAALVGYAGHVYWPALLSNKSVSSNEIAQFTRSASGVLATINLNEHGSPWQQKLKKALRVVLIGILLWLIPLVVLLVTFGWEAVYTQMAWFFTKAALLTFGGAYAVLPYVNQTVVEHFGWLTSAQMMDGLALGETTPGPLIMVVTFVGFVAGWGHGELASPLVSGVLAASVVTYFTFLPSFIFILVGAPLIESTIKNRRLTATLTAVSAAVVGVILSLALFFAHYVYWPNHALQPDWVAIGATVLAFMLLYRWKLSVVKLVAIFILLGLVRHVYLS